MSAPVRLLRRAPLFAGLEEVELADLAGRCQERVFTRGAPITSAGSRGHGFFVVAEGTASVWVAGRLARRLHAGDCFGALALIDGGRRTADITADTHVRCYGLSQRELRMLLRTHPDMAWSLLEQVVGMLREAQARPASTRPRRLLPVRRRAKPT